MVQLSPIKIRNYNYVIGTAADLPQSYTIPEHNIPTVHNQEETQMCVAYSLCEIAEGNDKRGIHYSPSFLYGRDECRKGYTGYGMFANTALKGVLNIGYLKEYMFSTMEDVPNVLKMAAERDDLLAESRKYKPAAFYDLSFANADKRYAAIRNALYIDKLPLLLISYTFFGTGHAVIAIGYKEEKGQRYIQFQNSWGEDYGEHGRSYIPLDKIDEIYKVSFEPPTIPFDDVKPTDWYYDDVRAAYLAEFINGIDYTTFAPEANIMRGDMALLLTRLLEKVQQSINLFYKGKKINKIVNYTVANMIPFTDVTINDYYYQAVKTMYGTGIMRGNTDTTFAPTDDILRCELAAMISRTYDLILKWVNYTPSTQPPQWFEDIAADAWYKDYVTKVNTLGLMQGDETGLFRPEEPISRAETAVIMQRFFKLIEEMLDSLI